MGLGSGQGAVEIESKGKRISIAAVYNLFEQAAAFCSNWSLLMEDAGQSVSRALR